MTATCSRCGERWDRDPALEVECPKCGAAAGSKCKVERPSGWTHSGKYAGLPNGVHPERDRKALEVVEEYEPCPAGPQQRDEQARRRPESGEKEQVELGL